MTALEMKRKPQLAKRLLKQSRGSWLITDPCLLGFIGFILKSSDIPKTKQWSFLAAFAGSCFLFSSRLI